MIINNRLCNTVPQIILNNCAYGYVPVVIDFAMADPRMRQLVIGTARGNCSALDIHEVRYSEIHRQNLTKEIHKVKQTVLSFEPKL